MWTCSHPCCSPHISCHPWLAPLELKYQSPNRSDIADQHWLIGHWVSSEPRVLPHLSLFCPSSPPLSCEASWETTKSNIKVHRNITHYCRIDYCHQCDKIYLIKSDIQVHTDISHQDYCHIGDTSYKTNFNMIVHVDRVREQDVRLPFLLCFTQPINEEDVIVGVDLPLSSTPDSGWAASNLLKLSIS